jgi:hypothetical protein
MSSYHRGADVQQIPLQHAAASAAVLKPALMVVRAQQVGRCSKEHQVGLCLVVFAQLCIASAAEASMVHCLPHAAEWQKLSIMPVS